MTLRPTVDELEARVRQNLHHTHGMMVECKPCDSYAALSDLAARAREAEALFGIAVRVSEADNQRLAAEGEPGFQAMREMEDALAALHRFVERSTP